MIFDITILLIAKHIEVSSCESYNGLGEHYRDGKRLTIDGWWDILTPDQKLERLTQAKGAWSAIQHIGVGIVMNQAFDSYVDEK